jgi:hypothetical protein
MQIKSQVERRVAWQLWTRTLDLINTDVQDQAAIQVRFQVNQVSSRVEWPLINPIEDQLRADIQTQLSQEIVDGFT